MQGGAGRLPAAAGTKNPQQRQACQVEMRIFTDYFSQLWKPFSA
jgi:hypothetical protein